MSQAPSDFKVTNVRRAILGARLAGVDVGRVDIAKDGTISIVPRDVRAPKPQQGKGEPDPEREIVL